ncbi:DUF7835 family putative zinc beta-ribbon protein [Halobacterium noricense]|uniref:DUF7835 family putative zinc beta-ribbon protein n=1 Tax=Halobacterium noricense TaxID=223182 RepID=UPI001E299B32|nr:hypothetical protein [Halobacterium noricense]UHH24547.1 hypothetical protein LT974_11195 [Halobacterium noricense]
MTTTAPDSHLREFCQDCDRATRHAVRIELRVENHAVDNPGCSREPYRVSRCLVCDATDARRMSDA